MQTTKDLLNKLNKNKNEESGALKKDTTGTMPRDDGAETLNVVGSELELALTRY